MKSKYTFWLVCASLFIIIGCKKKNTTSLIEEEKHQPVPPKYTAIYDRSTTPVNINIGKAITDSISVKLSEVASSIDYYAVGNDKYKVTNVIAVDGGFIALNMPKLYLYRKGMKRKRVGLKVTYNNWIYNSQPLYYDKKTTRLYANLTGVNKDRYIVYYISELPALDSVLARTHYLYPDSFPVRPLKYHKENQSPYFTSEMYLSPKANGIGIVKKITTFTHQDDTICTFIIPHEQIKNIPTTYIYGPHLSTYYHYENTLSFRTAFNDTIYRIIPPQTMKPVYALNLGKSRLSLQDYCKMAMNGKIWIQQIEETPKGVFIVIHQEENSHWSGWENDKRVIKQHQVDRQVLHHKSTGRTYALPINAGGLINDLDGGLPFWPDGQTDEYLYMIRPVAELKAKIKLTNSPKQKELKAFLQNVADDQNVMIVVK